MKLGQEIIEALKEAIENPETVKTVWGENCKLDSNDEFKPIKVVVKKLIINLGGSNQD